MVGAGSKSSACSLHGRSDLATLATLPQRLVCFPSLDYRFKLCAEVGYMEGFLVDNDRLCVNRFATVPLQGVCRVYGGYLLTRQISYCRYLPLESFGRIDSMTMPIVFAYRTGLCGVLPEEQGVNGTVYEVKMKHLPGSRNISPSSITISLNSPSSTTLSSIAPLCW